MVALSKKEKEFAVATLNLLGGYASDADDIELANNAMSLIQRLEGHAFIANLDMRLETMELSL